MNSKFSVIITVLNNDKYIRQCLESVIAQTVPPARILVHNDGSTDGTSEILDEYNGHPLLTITHSPDTRGCAARTNDMVMAAGTEYIALVDGDDYLEPNALEIVGQVLDNYNEVDLVYTDYNLVGPEGQYIGRSEVTGMPLNPINIAENAIVSHLQAFRSTAFCNIDPLETLPHDYELALKMYARNGVFKHVPLALYNYRKHPEQATVTTKDEVLADTIKLRSWFKYSERYAKSRRYR